MEKDRNARKSRKLLLGSRRRTIIAAVVVVILGFFAWRTYGQGQKRPQYQTAQVTRGTIIQTVAESGNVASGSHAGVGSPTTGIVQEIYVKDGDSVTAGQDLFKVKSIATAQEVASSWSSYQSALVSTNTAVTNKIVNQSKLEQDRAAVIAASTAVTNMQNNLNTSQNNPATKQPYTQNDIDAINSALTSARETFNADEQKYIQSDQAINSVNVAKDSAWLAYQATQDSVVTAPISGTIANITLKPGDQITASGGNLSSNISSSTNSNTNAVLYIGNYSAPYIKVQASEVDLPNIKAGQKATISLDAFPGKTFVGSIDQVDTAGTVSSGVVTYNVFVSFVSASDTIKPGMSVTVTIQTARKDDVLMVPSAAVQTSNGQSVVRVLQAGQVSSVPVETGLTSDSDTEISSSLSEGQTVVTGVISGQGSSAGSPFSGMRGFGGGGAFFRTGGGGGR